MNRRTVSLVVAALGMFSASPLAVAGEVVYSRPGTAGEYPSSFRARASTTLWGSAAATPSEALSVGCALKRGQVITPAGAVTQTYSIGVYTLKKDLEWELYTTDGQAKTVTLKAGQRVEDLSYGAEGICDVGVNGAVYSASCFNQAEEDSLRVESTLQQDTWYVARCANGKTAWFAESRLNQSKKLEAFSEFVETGDAR